SPESADRGEKAQTATTNGPKRDAETKSRLAIEVARQAALVTALTRATFRKSICSLTLRPPSVRTHAALSADLVSSSSVLRTWDACHHLRFPPASRIPGGM